MKYTRNMFKMEETSFVSLETTLTWNGDHIVIVYANSKQQKQVGELQWEVILLQLILRRLFMCCLCLYHSSIAAACWSFHYAKRLMETVFVHRFSHATMPIMNIFRVNYHIYIIIKCTFVQTVIQFIIIYN